MTKAQLVGLSSITGRLDFKSRRTWVNYGRERKPKRSTASQTSVTVTAQAPALSIRG